MASQQEFRRANSIINTVKRADGENANLFDVLDVTHTSQWWWKDHKKWFFYRFPNITMQKIEGNDYLVFTKERDIV